MLVALHKLHHLTLSTISEVEIKPTSQMRKVRIEDVASPTGI